jgi:predicted transcriptional regulator of viral defense system
MDIVDGMSEAKVGPLRATQLPTWLLAHGISSVTTEGIAELLGVPISHVPARIALLRERGEIVSPASGLWLPVPPEYVSWGAPPATDFIDTAMGYLHADYYVGWLSAAALHGASHHAPQVFQVAASRVIRERRVGRSLIRFYHRARVTSVPTCTRETRTGRITVSSRETTMLDIMSDLSISGGIDNAANILIEFYEDDLLDAELLLRAAATYPTSAIRRLGWLTERFIDGVDESPLYGVLASRTSTPSWLLPTRSDRGTLDRRWNLYINTEVEPDV